MEFGRILPATINSINFTLAPDTAFTDNVLAASASLTTPAVYIGCAKWGRKEWLGKIYPKGTKDALFLDQYIKHFNSIELNATHYQVYGPETIQNWAAKATGKDFLFCPKVPRVISHDSPLSAAGTAALTHQFLEGIRSFEKHLGPVFLQLSDTFSPARKDELFSYLKTLPDDLQFFLELRHPQWFTDSATRKEWLHVLRSLHIGAVITDTSGRRECAHMELTVPKTFIRFVGNSLHKTDYTRIDEWVTRIKSWLDNGLQELYFFMHQHNEAYSPELCDYTIEQLNKISGLQLKRPRFISETGSLF